MKIFVYIDCVDTLINDPDGFTYVAHFSYQNNNATPSYIPIGSYNMVTALSGSFSGTPPEIIYPGSGTFDVKFNGQLIAWTLKSYEGNQLKTSMADASASTCRCGDGCESENDNDIS